MYKETIQKKTITLGSAGLATAMVMTLVAGTWNIAEAGVFIDDEKKVQLYGDLRYRIEKDTRADNGKEDRDRDRSRLRARLGIKYKADNGWSGNIRLATNSNNNQSPHHSFGTVSGGTSSSDFGLDRAYVGYKGVENLTITAGINGVNFWQQSELFMDTDIGMEGVTASYKIAGLTLNAGYSVLVDEGWTDTSNKDSMMLIYQALYSQKISGMNLTAAIGGATLTNTETLVGMKDGNGNAIPGPFPLPSEQHLTASVQLKIGPFRTGVDYMDGDADEEETAFLIHARYKINDIFGVRVHYYDVGLNAVLAQGAFTQDDFPNFADFTGYQAQLDIKINKNVSADLRYFSQEEKKVEIGTKAWERTRLQANLNVKF